MERHTDAGDRVVAGGEARYRGEDGY
jgi:hypothetical protein